MRVPCECLAREPRERLREREQKLTGRETSVVHSQGTVSRVLSVCVCVSVIRIKKDEAQCFCASAPVTHASGYGDTVTATPVCLIGFVPLVKL